MIKTVVLALRPNSRFHFGKVSMDVNTALADTDEFLHSDVLFSALVNNLAQVKDKKYVDEFVTCFKNNQIKISSGFYCIKDEKQYHYLLPKPVTATNFIKDYSKIKTVKKLQFIPTSLWETSPNDWFESDCNETKQVLIPNETNFESIEHLYKKEIVPNLVKHKPNEDAKGPFSLAVIQIPKLDHSLSVHFYFLYEISKDVSEEMQKAFEYAVDMIAFNGLGGERSSGCGSVSAINWEVNQCPISDIETGLKINLGLFIPTEEEFKNCQSYKLVTRGGRKAKSISQLQRVRMISEGAIIKSENIQGKTEDLGGNHLRYGQPISINIPKFYDDERFDK
jgi:CRISPR-associated protein Csm4